MSKSFFKKLFVALLFSAIAQISFAHAINVGARFNGGVGVVFDGEVEDGKVFGLSAYCDIGFISGDFIDKQFGIRPEIATNFAFSPLSVKLPLVMTFSPNHNIDLGFALGPMFSFFRGGLGITGDAFFGFDIGPGKVVIDIFADFPFANSERKYLIFAAALGYQYKIL